MAQTEASEEFVPWAPDPPWEWRYQFQLGSDLWYRSSTDPREQYPEGDLYFLTYKGQPVSPTKGRRLWMFICKHCAPKTGDGRHWSQEPHWFWSICRWLRRHDVLTSVEGDLFANGSLKWPSRMVKP